MPGRVVGKRAVAGKRPQPDDAEPVREGTDAIVFVDGNGLIKAANEAFLNLTDSHSQSVVIDRAFSDFLSRARWT